MSTAADVVTEYIAAWTSGDIDAALARVSDDFAMQRWRPSPARSQFGLPSNTSRRSPEGRARSNNSRSTSASAVFELDVALAAGTTTLLIGEIDTVCDGRLTQSLLLFDSAAFRAGSPTNPSGDVSIDPVCGMTVDAATAAAVRRLDDREYRFCSTMCAETFDQYPERYSQGAPA